MTMSRTLNYSWSIPCPQFHECTWGHSVRHAEAGAFHVVLVCGLFAITLNAGDDLLRCAIRALGIFLALDVVADASRTHVPELGGKGTDGLGLEG